MKLKKIFSVCLIFILCSCCFVQNIYAESWISEQMSLNALEGLGNEVDDKMPVILRKLEKTKDGDETDLPVKNASFFLYTGNGEIIGGPYTTDENGEIKLELDGGDYYFEEITPPLGYSYEQIDGRICKKYPFDVAENEVIVTAYNQRVTGDLVLEKTIKNRDGSEITEEQKQAEFSFTLSLWSEDPLTKEKTMCRDAVVRYQIGNSAEVEISSNQEGNISFALKHGETIRFLDLPYHIFYRISEENEENYEIESNHHIGSINSPEEQVTFTNWYNNNISNGEKTTLRVKKVVNKKGATGYEEESRREFQLRLKVQDKEQVIALSDGAIKEVDVEVGQLYEVIEDSIQGYTMNIEKGYGTIPSGSAIEVVVTNSFDGTPILTTIKGEKTWKLNDNKNLPSSIDVDLLQNNNIIQTKLVQPDTQGKWLYQFIIPKYDNEGKQWEYSIKEKPISGFEAAYQGFDIINIAKDMSDENNNKDSQNSNDVDKDNDIVIENGNFEENNKTNQNELQDETNKNTETNINEIHDKKEVDTDIIELEDDILFEEQQEIKKFIKDKSKDRVQDTKNKTSSVGKIAPYYDKKGKNGLKSISNYGSKTGDTFLSYLYLTGIMLCGSVLGLFVYRRNKGK